MSTGRYLHIDLAVRQLSWIAQGFPWCYLDRSFTCASVMFFEHLPRMYHWSSLTGPWQPASTFLFRGALSTWGTLRAASLLRGAQRPLRGATQGVAWAGLGDIVQSSAPYTLLRLRPTCRTKPEGTFGVEGWGLVLMCAHKVVAK